MHLEAKVAKHLTQQKKTVAVAESCTGGLLAHRLTNVPGSSVYFILGLITYQNNTKKKLLKVPPRLLNDRKIGAVSYEVAEIMAKNVRKTAKTHFGIGITGIAGPSGGSVKKPIGLTYIAINTNRETLCCQCRFKGTRAHIKSQAATMALKLLLEFLE